MQERYEVFKTVAELVEFMLVREHRGMWFYAHAGGLSDMEFVLDELLQQIKDELAAGRSPRGNRCEAVARRLRAGRVATGGDCPGD